MDLQLQIDQDRCTGCGMCVDDCPYAILQMMNEQPCVDEEKADQCIRCQHCLAICPTGALSVFGISPDDSIDLHNNLPTPMQVETLLRGRRSVRRYSSRPLSQATIQKLLTVAGNAPTGVNNRQFLFTLVEDQAVMEQIRQQTIAGIRKQAEAEQLPQGLEFFAGIIRAWDSGNDILFRKAPHMLIISSPKNGPSPEADCYIALTYFEIMAASMGVGTLWDGLAKWAFTSILPETPAKLGIPDDHMLGYVMLFGKPAVKYHRTVQRDTVGIRKVTAF
ncbi:nitroreductase family protein [Desulfogranum japonicum]|uniref:nitroreductase family protein n=1 Tax=Desulfogranum japonicum TaxID=231447 RepID=UPI00040B65A0|nr:nitroreductase family protein [Desulfogranum japonicum]